MTEQYPRGLGPTVPELGASDLTPHEKTQFSMLTEEVEKQLQALGGPKKAILCGIEAQACIAVRGQNKFLAVECWKLQCLGVLCYPPLLIYSS